MSSYFLLHVWESAFNVIYLLPLKNNKCKNDECEKTIGTPSVSGGGVIGFVGCHDNKDDYDGPAPGIIWDFMPFAVNIMVTDAAGNDLLNPETENSIADNGIKARFKGRVFEKDSIVLPGQTKAVMSVFYGLRSVKLTNGFYGLSFGEFSGDNNYGATDIVLDWNDGTPCDTITFSHRFWWEGHDPNQETFLYLNGVETDAPVHIIK